MQSWIEVSAERLEGNFACAAAIAQREAGAALLAVIKADAYGHGAALCAPVLARAGAAWLGVTDAAEGARVRGALMAAGLGDAGQPGILVMCGHLPGDAARIVAARLTPVVWTEAQMAALAAAAVAEPLPVHLEIDTGMSRQGVAVEELRPLLRWLAGEPRLRLDGVMTHFASAEVAASGQTAAQRERFASAIRIVREEGARPAWVHAGNSAAIDNAADDNAADGGTLAWLRGLAESVGARPMVREGLGLFGYTLPLAGLTASDGEGTSRLGGLLRPVMTWKTRIISICEVEAGALVGYNGSFVAPRRMRLALVAVGYADGLRRELSSSSSPGAGKRGGWVTIGGKRAAIVGRVSMNLTTLDVSLLDGVEVGEEVVVLGEGTTAEDHAAVAGTIAYEILCGMRAPAAVVETGEQ